MQENEALIGELLKLKDEIAKKKHLIPTQQKVQMGRPEISNSCFRTTVGGNLTLIGQALRGN